MRNRALVSARLVGAITVIAGLFPLWSLVGWVVLHEFIVEEGATLAYVLTLVVTLLLLGKIVTGVALICLTSWGRLAAIVVLSADCAIHLMGLGKSVFQSLFLPLPPPPVPSEGVDMIVITVSLWPLYLTVFLGLASILVLTRPSVRLAYASHHEPAHNNSVQATVTPPRA